MKDLKQWLLYRILREFKKYLVCIGTLSRFLVRGIADLIRDNQLGIETNASCQWKDNSKNKDMCGYSPTSYRSMQKILDYLNLGPDDVFVDLGCGQGRAVFMAAFRRIRKAFGVELNKDLWEGAEKNLRTIKAPHAPIEFICADAASFHVSDGTVYYLYNPFGYETTAAVMENVKASLAACPRRVRIISKGPSQRDLIDRQQWLEFEIELDHGNILIWHSLPGAI